MLVFENEFFALAEADAGHLRRIVGGNLLESRGLVAIRRSVGHVVLPSGVVLRIRSRKASTASFLAWAAFADPRFSGVEYLGQLEDSVDLGDLAGLTARLFLRETLRAAARYGMTRSYERREIRSAVVRGRIQFERLARQGGQVSRMPCLIWERSVNTPLNRFLAAALRVVTRDAVMMEAAAELLPQVRSLLAGVQPGIDEGLLSGGRELPRSQEGFTGACALARLILRTIDLTEGRRFQGIAFLVNLEALFERTVSRALELAGVVSEAKRTVRYLRGTSGDLTFSGHGAMEIDVFCPSLPNGATVVDAKYKSGISAGNLQQMVAYCWLSGARHAILVVPSGAVSSPRAYAFPMGRSETERVRVDVLELPTDATSIAGWRASARALGKAVVDLSSRLADSRAKQ